MWDQIRDILADAVVVCCLVVVIHGIDLLSHTLVPPDGPIFFRYTMFEFPFQWLIDAGHIVNFGAFVVRMARRMWR